MRTGRPGFGFIIARRDRLMQTKGCARSLSLDIYDQWETMERGHGKWRFTSPTHVVRAFYQAMQELKAEGGIAARHRRYVENHRVLVEGMRSLGFQTLLADEAQGCIITSFLYPDAAFDFASFYEQLKARGFVIYPGKISRPIPSASATSATSSPTTSAGSSRPSARCSRPDGARFATGIGTKCCDKAGRSRARFNQ